MHIASHKRSVPPVTETVCSINGCTSISIVVQPRTCPDKSPASHRWSMLRSYVVAIHPLRSLRVGALRESDLADGVLVSSELVIAQEQRVVQAVRCGSGMQVDNACNHTIVTRMP